jgi:DNA repair exonuclease SbcCD ATPase subunit
MVAEIQNANTTLIQSAQARGDTATARQANMINNAMQTLATYETAEIKARSADATNKMSTQIANYERKISEIGMFAEQAQNKIQARIDRGDTLRDVQNDARDSLEKISEQFNELQNEAVRTDPAVQLLNRKIAEAIDDDDVDEANRLRAQIPREVARIQEEFIIANSQLYDTYKSLTDTVNSLGSQIQSTVMGDSGISNQQVDDIVKRQLQKGTPEYLQPYNP